MVTELGVRRSRAVVAVRALVATRIRVVHAACDHQPEQEVVVLRLDRGGAGPAEPAGHELGAEELLRAALHLLRAADSLQVRMVVDEPSENALAVRGVLLRVEDVRVPDLVEVGGPGDDDLVGVLPDEIEEAEVVA